ncbi:MAG: hypothetical protein ABSA34_00440 [Candidatus Goldiibacteriota bacterium]
MQVRGSAFKSILKYAEKKHGIERVKNFFIDNPSFCAIKDYIDLDWYDLKFYLDYSEKTDKYFGFGDGSLLFEAGEFASRQAFESSHRLFKDMTMQSALANAETVFLSYFSAAVVEIKYIKDNKASIYIKNLPVSPYLAKNICGWIKHAVKSIKAKEPSITETTPKTCLCFTLEWINEPL